MECVGLSSGGRGEGGLGGTGNAGDGRDGGILEGQELEGKNGERSGGSSTRETMEKSVERMVGYWRENGGAVQGRQNDSLEAAALVTAAASRRWIGGVARRLLRLRQRRHDCVWRWRHWLQQ